MQYSLHASQLMMAKPDKKRTSIVRGHVTKTFKRIRKICVQCWPGRKRKNTMQQEGMADELDMIYVRSYRENNFDQNDYLVEDLLHYISSNFLEFLDKQENCDMGICMEKDMSVTHGEALEVTSISSSDSVEAHDNKVTGVEGNSAGSRFATASVEMPYFVASCYGMTDTTQFLMFGAVSGYTGSGQKTNM